MRPRFLLIAGFLLICAVCPLFGQGQALYKLEKTGDPVVETITKNGKNVTMVTVKFTITAQGKQTDVGSDYLVLIEEEGQVVKKVPLPKPKASQDLSVMLAVDTSGSMSDHGRMEQARQAANVFFSKLPGKAEAGLILFDHLVHTVEPLTKDPERTTLKAQIARAKPGGGTAYFDACWAALDQLKTVQKAEKAIVLMTDGIDLNSQHNLMQVIARAKRENVKVYPIGIGQPGKQQPITTLLVLDKSLSMLSPVDDKAGGISKMDALKESATQFVKIMPESEKHPVRSSVIRFSSTVEPYGDFIGDKKQLMTLIQSLQADGETALFDATYDAIAMLEAENPPGKKAVVALTDGIDNASRHRVEEVITRAKKAGIALFMLGFGKKGELDEKGELDVDVMTKMATETGGQFYLASNREDLLQIFESLSVKIHDDGIDEASLQQLAADTGGKYYPATNIDQLQFILEQVTVTIQRKEYEVSFPSRFQREDAAGRKIELKLVRQDGSVAGGSGFVVLQEEKTSYRRRGLILAQMSPLVYLSFLVGLGILLALPVGLKKLAGGSARR